MIELSALLAQVPQDTIYLSPIKLLGIMAVFIIWALFSQWIDKDTVAVNTFRVLWNMIMMATGLVGLALALFIPLYFVGLPLYVVLVSTVATVYIVHRNGLVDPEYKVFTAAHFKRLKEQGFSGKKKLKEVKEKVRITGANRKVVAIPEEEQPREQYRLAQELLFDVLWRRAALVELAPAKEVAKLTYTIDGVNSERQSLPRAEADAILTFLKTIAGLNLEEKRKPQSGKIMTAIGENKYEVVVRSDGSTAGEKLTLRVLGGEHKFKMPDLGFNPRQVEAVRSFMDAPRGVILLSGPAGSGLTTSVYSFARSHDAFLQNIQTLEHQKEVEVDNITQHVFAPADDKTFAQELQKLIRTDPDVVIVPEVRDRETAALIAKAASEKQKIYAGLPAGDVFDALRKWVQLVGDRNAAARSLLAVVNQRLLRVLCTACKQAYKPDPNTMQKLNMPADKVLQRVPDPVVDKHGNPIICQNCQGTGYVGRTGVFDVLVVDDALREVIRKADAAELQTYATKRGAVGLQAQGLHKALEGLTSIQEVVRVTRSAPPGAAPTPQPKPRPAPAAPTQA